MELDCIPEAPYVIQEKTDMIPIIVQEVQDKVRAPRPQYDPTAPQNIEIGE